MSRDNLVWRNQFGTAELGGMDAHNIEDLGAGWNTAYGKLFGEGGVSGRAITLHEVKMSPSSLYHEESLMHPVGTGMYSPLTATYRTKAQDNDSATRQQRKPVCLDDLRPPSTFTWR